MFNRLRKSEPNSLFNKKRLGRLAAAKKRQKSSTSYQSLEPRQLLAASAVLGGDGLLTIIGTNFADEISLTPAQDTSIPTGSKSVRVVKTFNVNVRTNSQTSVNERFIASEVDRIKVISVDGNDTIDLSNAEAGITADVFAGNGNDTIVGTPSNDRLYGQAGDDIISGGSGNDTIADNAGDNFIDGGDGNDRLFGGLGSDTISGGDGNDRIGGNAGDDLLQGGSGDDTIVGGNGLNRIYGEAGNDKLFGGNDADEIFGGEGVDVLLGYAGNDELIPGAGGSATRAEFVLGGTGNDTLVGGDGSNIFRGEQGNDVYIIRGNDSSARGFDSISELAGQGTDEVRADNLNIRLVRNLGDRVIVAHSVARNINIGPNVETIPQAPVQPPAPTRADFNVATVTTPRFNIRPTIAGGPVLTTAGRFLRVTITARPTDVLSINNRITITNNQGAVRTFAHVDEDRIGGFRDQIVILYDLGDFVGRFPRSDRTAGYTFQFAAGTFSLTDPAATGAAAGTADNRFLSGSLSDFGFVMLDR